MLHLIFQTPIEPSVLQRIAPNDDVVFYENAVFQLNTGNRSNQKLQQLIENQVKCYVLKEELETRGLNIKEVIDGIKQIDYPELVQLTVNNKAIKTWN